MTNVRPVIRILGRAALVAGVALLLVAPADAGKASRTRRSSASTAAPRTAVSGSATPRVRAGRHVHRHGYRYRVGIGYGHHYGPHYGYGWHAWPRVYVHGYYGYPTRVYGPTATYDAGVRYGALDLDVRPRTTEIYVDGEYVGLARRFDGWPDVLWLEPGRHDVSFYREGYATVTRTFMVTGDAVLEVRERLKKGESVRPEPPPVAAGQEAPAARRREAPDADRPDDAGTTRSSTGVVAFPRRSAGGDR